MSFHTGQTFTFGEQPSATKWQWLWDNDYALADGSGIEDDAIDSRHIVDGAIDFVHLGTDVGAFQLLADVTLGSAADSISSGTITARKLLRIYLFGIDSGNITSNLRFNGDTGNNYSFNRVSGDSTSQSSIGTGDSNMDQFSVIDIINNQSQEKLTNWYTTFASSAGAGAAPIWDRVTGKWANTSAQITSVTAINGGTGDLAAGSRLVVMGRD